jgi:threonyl-tRNA synthetase
MQENQNESLEKIRHSLAHVMAYSVKQLYPGSHNAIGPAIESGFYQDFEIKGNLGEDDLARIEQKMHEVLSSWGGFERREVSLEQALEIFADNPYKQELAREFSEGGKTLTVYTSGDFDDLCKGGHVDSIKDINPEAFTLTKTAGAYWRGDEKNIMLTRIYGVAFADKAELADYLALQEEAKKRDHRKLGQELDLFVFSDLVGSGLPLFTPRGTILRDELVNYSNSLRQRHGFEKVWIPHITKTALYEKSGHWAKFGDELFLVKSQETSDEFVMKPMNCPHHTQIYASQPRSYRQLPVRYLETTTVYRDEKTGELGGLSRVRSITQDDSHAFCREDQIGGEIDNLLAAAYELYSNVGMRLSVRLSYRDDSESYLGELSLWQSAQDQLRAAVEKNGLEYFEQTGEAAFYGPKIDFMATDALGRQHQVATVQLDFVMPERFGLVYTTDDGSKAHPVMIHCALLGSVERFLSVYIEHTAGRFPIWLAPEQLRIVQVKDSAEIEMFLQKMCDEAAQQGLRLTVDASNETVGKKIRAAEMLKIPYIIVIGEKEVETGMLTPRIRKDLMVEGHVDQSYPRDILLHSIANEVRGRVQNSSL